MKQYYTWEQFDTDCKGFSASIKNEGFTHIYGIPRGGLIVAVRLSHLLGIPLLLHPETFKSTTLVVDDISDSGNTLQKLIDTYGTFTSFALFFKPESKVVPTYASHSSHGHWIVFPWETEVSSKYDNTTIE